MRILLFSNLYQLECYQKYSIRPYSELQSRKISEKQTFYNYEN